MSNAVKYSTSSLSNSTLVGPVAFGWAGNDWGPSTNTGWYAGVTPPSGGWAIYATSSSQIASITVAQNDADLLIIAREFTNQTFTSASEAETWMNANGYAVVNQVFSGNYTFSPTVLGWTFSSNTGSMTAAGYTAYDGGFANNDDGRANYTITLPATFSSYQTSTNQLWAWTNGFFVLGGNGNDITYRFMGNDGDLWLQPGTTNSEGDAENWWYQTGSEGGNKFFIKNVVFGGVYPGNGSASSYLINLYKDSQYQWVETRVKSNVFGSAGLASVSTNVASTVSQVWRGSLDGQLWTYMGTGSVVS